ncbi:hypothetical protein [Prosthecobacter sp.]|uniref:hypothetical protein n=1 Tax=Prosthecobacter sp. TaxID=1965333 RepID=UPI003784C0D8
MSTSYPNARQHIQEAYPEALFKSQTAAEWTGPFELPVEILDYYQTFGPVDVNIAGYGNPYFLPSLARLWSFQAGYRYHPQSGETFPDWNADWLVVADEGGDPFIFSLSAKTILHAYHGEGSWNPEPIFNRLGDMVFCFATLGHIVARNPDQLTDEDDMIQPQHIESARNRMVSELGSTEKAEFILASMAWTR